MRKLVFLSILLIVQVSFAHGPLHDAMKEMGESFKLIGIGLQSGEVTEAERDSSEELQMAISTASLHYPGTASTDSLKLEYSQWMAELMNLSLQLEEAIEIALSQKNQDLTTAIQIFSEMNELRKKGHAKFKDEH